MVDFSGLSKLHVKKKKNKKTKKNMFEMHAIRDILLIKYMYIIKIHMRDRESIDF